MFPLPLTAFEEYMLRDDRPAYPATVFFRFRFRGHLQPAPFEAAVAAVADRHPMLRTTVQLRRGGRPQWLDRPGWRPAVHWHVPAGPYGYPSAPTLDPTQEPGVRFWVLDHAAGQDLVVQVHHATSDARGFAQVAEELLMSYALHCGNASADLGLPVLEPQRLRLRGTPGMTFWRFLKKIPRQLQGLRGVYRFLKHRPVPLASPATPIDDSRPPCAFPCSQTHDFTTAETARLVAAAKRQQVTVNDVLVRDAFVTLARWRQLRGLGSEQEWLRLAIPVNLRGAGDERMPMANAVSMVFLDRRPVETADADGLLRSVRQQMQWAKRGQSQYTYIQSLGLVRRLPGGLPRTLRADKCRATCVLSNLGPALVHTPLPRDDGRLVVGNVVLESMDFVPPLRPHVHAAFAVCTYAGRMRVVLHANPLALPDGQPRELLDRFARQVLRSADEPRLDRAEAAA